MLIGQILATKGRDVVTIGPDATVAEAARLLRDRRIGAIVVIEGDGGLCGILSERDVAHGLADRGSDLLDMRVADLMTPDVITCAPGDGIEKLMADMTKGRVRHLPVIDDGRLAGLISIGDLVKHRLEELEAEAHLLHDYIAGGA